MSKDLHSLLDDFVPEVPTLHNGRTSAVEVQTEKPWHRTAAYLLATGKTQIEVAAALDKTPQMISILSAQGWFQRLVADLISNEGGNEVMEIMKNAAATATLRLVEMTQGFVTGPQGTLPIKPETQLSSIKDLLDRHLGKAPQHIEYSEKEIVGDPQEKLEELNKQLEQLRRN